MSLQTTSGAVDRSTFVGTRWDGERIAALAAGVAGNSERDPIRARAPAVDEPIGTVPRLGEATIHGAVERARDAGGAWADRPVAERTGVLDRFADLVERHQAELLDLIQLETGKARRDALEEIVDPPLWADYYAETAADLLADERRRSLVPVVTTAEVTYDPVGVAGIISPWNYPLALSFIDAIPALVAGNGVGIKPDDRTPYTAFRLRVLYVEAKTIGTFRIGPIGSPPLVPDRLYARAVRSSSRLYRRLRRKLW